ncbi:ABC transporter ATP-binding protein/permease [Schaalia sp. 19OD2882]|uniref:ABC transporter ATP-binding protein/permease n=1 Tax=Schaalia sp. 19OD2882 TaxID=2794089 RepID=UPI001C1F14C4|nr:ABC transporter ATP-binding protein/permease [Schaalia sp. 19OD2882]QWW20044.1 ABC transporter ATP-binding protein/permease [Schaalia sp. 19OD2882]
MLELREITKAYRTASLTQVALDGVRLAFRDNEFVAVLGQSGSGKTTMLNIIGGLDRFDSGDLVIDGISTKDYRDRDWDTYRNNRIGFVFQSYNLIPHQSVLANVELALTLSGVGRGERRRRALAALDEVGLADHVHKKPGQLSGGQMQRVAIARALVNDPEILLADEPTGALDSQTSVQVMDLLKEVARDRLVIMVTHNPDLAHAYATRIVELADGRVLRDSAPFTPGTEELREARPTRRASMSLLTALSLSFTNLMTKKGRTLMTSFAGSIGIIGIAAILALANGVNAYIDRTEEEMLTAYPLSIQRTGMDLTAVMGIMQDADSGTRDAPASDGAAAGGSGGAGGADQTGSGGGGAGGVGGSDGAVSTRATLERALGAVSSNDLASLKTYLDANGGQIRDHVRAIEYEYDVTPLIHLPDTGRGTKQVNPSTLVNAASLPSSVPRMFRANLRTDSFAQLPVDPAVYSSDYDVKAGHWPEGPDELVLVLPKDGRLFDVLEFNMGLRDTAEIDKMVQRLDPGGSRALDAGQSVGAAPSAPSVAMQSGQGGQSSGDEGGQSGETAQSGRTYDYDELMGVEFRLVHAHDMYTWNAATKVWTDRSDDAAHIDALVAKGRPLHVTGVVQVKADTDASPLRSGLYYTQDLVREVMREAASSQIVRQQIANPKTNVFNGKAFADPADSPMSGFDMASLFSIDEKKIQAAFSFDESALAASMSRLDLSGIDLSALQGVGLEMPPLDIESLDLSGLGQIDLSAMDLSGIDTASLQKQFPQLANVKWDRILSKALADGALTPEAGQIIGGLTQQLLREFIQYQSAHAGAGKDSATLAIEYFSQPEVRERLRATLMDPRVINQDKLTSNLVTALGQDPALVTVGTQVGQEIAGQIATQLATQVGSQVAATIGSAISTQLQSAMTGYMTQMMGILQEQISARIESTMSSMAQNMSSAMKIDQKAFAQAFTSKMDAKDLASYITQMMSASTESYESNLTKLGWGDLSDPSNIDIYPRSFEDKDAVKAILDSYNTQMRDSGRDKKAITYSDLVGTLMTSVTQIVNMISSMLIAFVAISLVVSSIMIGIITYISVLERKKEIGILRSIGASKGDVRSVFNAETFLVGLLAGAIGVAFTALATIPTNIIVEQQLGVAGIAQLPVLAGVVLIGISVLLTLAAGLLPAGAAAKADPVEALRSE